MSSPVLTWKEYNKKSLAVHGDRNKYSKLLKPVGARWNSRMKGQPGWTVPKEKLQELQKIIDMVNNHNKESVKTEKKSNTPLLVNDDKASKSSSDEGLKNIESHVKSRKSQHKYHRAVSESSESESENSSDNDNNDNDNNDNDKNDNSDSNSSVSAPEQSPSKRTHSPQKRTHSPQKRTHSPQDTINQEYIEQIRREEREKFEREKIEHQQQMEKLNSMEESKYSYNEDDVKYRRNKDKEKNKKIDKKHDDRHKHKTRKTHYETRSSSSNSSSSDSESSQRDKKTLEYYKSFSKNPSKFKSLYYSDSSSSSYSSSEEESDSSEDFPSPRTPKRKNKKISYEELYSKYNNLQRKLYESEIGKRR